MVETHELNEADVAAILADYQRKQFFVHMVGPLVSLLVHIVAISLMMILITGKPPARKPTIEVEIEDVELKELETEVLEEIEEIDEEIAEEAPQVETTAPTAGADAAPLADVVEAAPEVDAGDFDMQEVMDVEVSGSPLVMPEVFSQRTQQGRTKQVRRGGGSVSGQHSVGRALTWLKENQNPDGSWANVHKASHTGFALLAFLAHGETPLSEEYGEAVQNGIWYLQNRMIHDLKNPTGMCGGTAYEHGISTYALAEAYGMTKIPSVKKAMDLGVERIIKGQKKNGGFNYRYTELWPVIDPQTKKKIADKPRWDLSVAGWQYQALKAGFVAGSTASGLERAIEESVRFLKSEAYKDKKFGYASAGSGGNMTGVGTVALQLLGEGECREVKGALETISNERMGIYKECQRNPAAWGTTGGTNLYGFYYDTQAMFNAGGGMWRAWRKVFEPTLIRAQNRNGYWETAEGSHNNGGELDGRIMCTALSVLQLEVYYRYLPTFDIKKMEHHRVKSTSLSDLDTGNALIIQ